MFLCLKKDLTFLCLNKKTYVLMSKNFNLMSTAQLTAELLQQMSLITDDESKLKRALKALKRITTPKPDPTEMTYEEFTAMVNRSREQYNQGKYKSFASVEELDRYIQSRL